MHFNLFFIHSIVVIFLFRDLNMFQAAISENQTTDSPTPSFSLTPMSPDAQELSDEADEMNRSSTTNKLSRQASITESFSIVRSFAGDFLFTFTFINGNSMKNHLIFFPDGGKKSTKINNAIIFMIAKDNLPLNTTEKEGFQYLMKTIAPLYQAPRRKKITEQIDEKYDLLAGLFKEILRQTVNITLTADVWTETMSTKSFLGLTGHYVLENKFHSVTIGVIELDQSHTAQYLGERILSICEDWYIFPSKVTAVVTDNGANIVKAVSDVFGKNKHLPCFAHTLDLVASKITDHVQSVKDIIEKIRAIVTYFKQSVAASDLLRKAQDSQTPLRLIQSVPTRWNSKYYMLERFLKLYEFVAAILIKNPKSPEMITALELKKVKEVLNILGPIEAVSREMCGEKYLTASKVIPIINCLCKQLENFKPATEDVLALKTLTISELSNRFGCIESNKIYAVSTILDPRFKRLHFNSPISCANAVTFINQTIQTNKKKITNDDFINENQTNITNSSETLNSVWAYHETLAQKFTEQHHEVNKGDIEFEFKVYLTSQTMSLNSDPLLYWNGNSSSSEILKELAKKFISIVATSVPSERLFSEAGNILTQSRNRLLGHRLSKLLFLHSLNVEDWHF